METLTHAMLLASVTYDKETGWFIRRTVSQSKRPGVRAGSLCLDGEGYRKIIVKGRRYREHRLALFYVNGVWPSEHVDHINRIYDDNRFDNLRDATNAQNAQNVSKAQSNNKSSKLLGSYRHSDGIHWVGSICKDGIVHYLGMYDTALNAHLAYMAAKRSLHPYGEIAKDVNPFTPPKSKRVKTYNKARLAGVVRYGDVWKASLTRKGTRIKLGTFTTELEASAAYLAAKSA